MNWIITRATPDRADEVAALYRRTAEREWDFLYPHTPQEDLAFFAQAFTRGVVWAAIEDGAVIGFCAARRGWIDHLYVDHARHGQGVGRSLLAATLARRRHVKLWTFQRNARSRRFYALQGFTEVRFTDGADNEEREPDVLLAWRAGSDGWTRLTTRPHMGASNVNGEP